MISYYVLSHTPVNFLILLESNHNVLNKLIINLYYVFDGNNDPMKATTILVWAKERKKSRDLLNSFMNTEKTSI